MPIAVTGTSPRVRGNHNTISYEIRTSRYIPTRAGQPRPGRRPVGIPGVHPHACGATEQLLYRNHPLLGTSPRVRGNLPFLTMHSSILRYIPTRAGQPHRRRRTKNNRRVHPHACGATFKYKLRTSCRNGTSPRVRGNPIQLPLVTPAGGYIPTRAGQPGEVPRGRKRLAVHPHACGATYSSSFSSWSTAGTSPRVRGNRVRRDSHIRIRGYIPTRAGQPFSSMDNSSPNGGTSPRVRGNLLASNTKYL